MIFVDDYKRFDRRKCQIVSKEFETFNQGLYVYDCFPGNGFEILLAFI